MKRLSLILIVLSLALAQRVHAQYYSVNYDARTVAAMAAAFGTETVAESYYREQVDDILKHYNAAEVATAGIFASKFLEHKALEPMLSRNIIKLQITDNHILSKAQSKSKSF